MRINSIFRIFTIALALGCAACKSGPSATGKISSGTRIPFGALDTPAEGAVVNGFALASGWALSEDGVDHVEIYLDRTFLQNATMKGKRDDVIKVYPAFAGVQDVMFQTELQGLKFGIHEISARVVSRKQQTRDLVPHRINVTR